MTRSTNDWSLLGCVSLATAALLFTQDLIAVALKSISFFRTCLMVRRVVPGRPEEKA